MNSFSGDDVVFRELATKRPPLECLDAKFFPDNGPKAKTLIEISGDADSGKSMLLWQIMARCLPPTYFCGKYADVILINSSHAFRAPYFVHYLKQHIRATNKNCTNNEIDGVLQKCVDSVTLLNCYSATEFDLAFDAVENVLYENDNVAMLAVDSMHEFYWEDTREKRMRMSTHYARNIARLRYLCEKHNICCAFTVDCNYLGVQGTTDNPSGIKPADKINYRFRLEHLDDDTRLLNSKPITIDDDGLRFD